VQHETFRARPLSLTTNTRRWVAVTLGAIAMQIALGGWVSTNYAVLACREFPLCDGQWWPQMDLGSGFSLLRELGRDTLGGALGSAALVAIHMVHRWFAVVVTIVTIGLVHSLWREPGETPRRFAWALGLLLFAQLLSGLSNVVLGWPLAAALAHSAGAAALVMLAVMLLSRGTRLAAA
jgi:heme a synthase